MYINKLKLNRAIAAVGNDPEEVKKEYIRIGGLLDQEKTEEITKPVKKSVKKSIKKLIKKSTK